MPERAPDPRRPPRAGVGRWGFAARACLTLAPLLVVGLGRPLAGMAGVGLDAGALVAAALVLVVVALVTRARRPGATVVAVVLAAMSLGALVALPGGVAGTAVPVAALLVLGLVATLTLPGLVAALPAQLDVPVSGQGWRWAVAVALGGLVVLSTARLSVFMGDAGRPEMSLAPDVVFFVEHACLTAYVEAAELARAGVENLYEASHWPDLNGTPRGEASRGAYAPFGLDAYAYPPPFLLVPMALLGWMGDFASQRAAWFALNGLVVAVGLWTVARSVGGRGGLYALVLAPLVWTSVPVLGALQVGNVHLVVTAAAMLALVAFESGRRAAGGALLAFAVVAKLSPAVLVAVLLLRGRLREVAWTAAFGGLFTLAGLVAFGPAPFTAFVGYELPRLASGGALSFLAESDSVPINLAPFGIPFKLAFLGIPVAEPWALGRLLNQAFTGLLVVLAVVAARAHRGRQATLEAWAALLTLCALRSPLAPGYVLFSFLWLVSLRAGHTRGWPAALAWGAAWLLVAVLPPLAPTSLAVATLLQQVVVLGLSAYVVLRPSRPVEAG